MIVAENARATGRLHPAHTDIVFDGNRHTREHPLITALLDLLSPPHRPFAIDLEKSIQRLIEPLRSLYRKFNISSKSW